MPHWGGPHRRGARPLAHRPARPLTSPPSHRPLLQGGYFPQAQQPYVNNGQMYGGWRPPYQQPQYAPQQQPQQQQQPQRPPPQQQPSRQQAAPAAAAPTPSQELTQTATIRNAVDLKKATLAVTPLPDNPAKLAITFTFDASQPCAVTTFVAATEEPARGCRLAPAKQEAAAPLYYEKGVSCSRCCLFLHVCCEVLPRCCRPEAALLQRPLGPCGSLYSACHWAGAFSWQWCYQWCCLNPVPC